jgi:hypothetical protein
MAKKKNTIASFRAYIKENCTKHIETGQEEEIRALFNTYRKTMNRYDSIIEISALRLIPPQEISELLRDKYHSFT